MNNITGITFGHLVVLGPSNRRHKSKEIMWECRCECGNKCYYRTTKLTQGLRVSCGKCTRLQRKKRHWSRTKQDREKQGKVRFSQLTMAKQLDLISSFSFGLSYKELSEKHLVTTSTLKNGIRLYRDKLNSAFELNYMANAKKTVLSASVIEKALQTTFVSDTLRDMLSADEEETLTDHEIMYCYLFVNTGSNEIAMRESQLDECLDDKTPIRVSYLGMFLRQKPNLKLYIQTLQQAKIDEVKASKEIVQRELILQIEQVKEIVSRGTGTVGDRSNLIRLIELLGKSVGAFVDKIEVTEVKAADALDTLLDMAKKSVKDGGEEWSLPKQDSQPSPEYPKGGILSGVK